MTGSVTEAAMMKDLKKVWQEKFGHCVVTSSRNGNPHYKAGLSQGGLALPVYLTLYWRSMSYCMNTLCLRKLPWLSI
jgi:hypothetical protein